MSETLRNRTDLNHLLTLIGMLGEPEDGGFWESWRTDLHGYAFKKMKNGIERCADPNVQILRVQDFADYILMFFSTDSAGEESELADKIARYVSTGDGDQPGIQFLQDIRATAWRLYRDNSQVLPETVIKNWGAA